MRVLFLDVDGVLNRDGTKETVKLPLGVFTGVDAVLLARFQQWLKGHPDLLIVLSSTWRLSEDAKEHLRSLGLDWCGETPTQRRDRSEEVKDWLALHPTVTHYAVLDDLAVRGGHLVQTSPKHGLREGDLKKLDIMLGYTKEVK